jgi:hypothetical protein
MPYIKQEDRLIYNNLLLNVKNLESIPNKGDLEFLIFALMKKYMSTREQRYSTLHDCVYAPMHCADEFRRRYLDKREDNARQANGDVEI